MGGRARGARYCPTKPQVDLWPLRTITRARDKVDDSGSTYLQSRFSVLLKNGFGHQKLSGN